jgi:hypothetical protein
LPFPTCRNLHAALTLAAAAAAARGNKYDLDKVPGPWTKALPLVGNVLDCLRPDFHRVLLKWADEYGGIYRMKFLWHDTLIVTGGQPCSCRSSPGIARACCRRHQDDMRPCELCCYYGMQFHQQQLY